MEEAKVAIFEDHPIAREAAVWAVEAEDSPHKVVAQADTLNGALDVIDRIAAGNLACSVVVLGGHLGSGSPDRDDAKRIADAIAAAGLDIRTIGYSLVPMSAYGVAVDVDPGKQSMTARLMREILDNL